MLTHNNIISRFINKMAEKIDKLTTDTLIEEAFYQALGEDYRKYFTNGFKFSGAQIVEQEIAGNKITMYQGIWRGEEKLDGIIRKISVKKETIDAKIKGGEK